MKLGYFTLTDNPPAYGASRKDPSRLLKEVLAQCIHAEKIGLNSVWVPEHHFGLFGVLPSAPVFLAKESSPYFDQPDIYHVTLMLRTSIEAGPGQSPAMLFQSSK
ncbi:MAG: LLM class flavin-dependent oxidoreductase [Chloroflexi bacterium]|nr:LLM class flavin-dependent oxidoreductase [Chloroflexota bacterium]MCH8894380.1 LLM class flavin-dependent oxidoreductase [Chloroflexota bacterium]MCH9018236.1 LLM class flavin-dependent oxidoreductase [Chloroflexota bacterium]